MQDFFGWKSPSMTMEYISTSKSAVKAMANKLNPVKQETEDPVRKGEALKKDVDPVIEQQEDVELDNVETNNGQGENEEPDIEERRNEQLEENGDGSKGKVSVITRNLGNMDVSPPSIMNNQKVVVAYGDFNGTIM